MTLRVYIKNNLIAIDRVGNTLLAGDPDETLSARSGRLRDTSRCWRVLARILDRIQPFHDQLAIEHDRHRAETLAALETAQEAATDAEVERLTKVPQDWARVHGVPPKGWFGKD